MFRLNLFKATALFFTVWAALQIRFISEGQISHLGPASKADKTLVFQGHANNEQNDNRLSRVVTSSEAELPDNTVDHMGPPKTEVDKMSNTGNLAVGFGENAPASVPNRVGMPKIDRSSSIFQGQSVRPAVQQGAPKQIFVKHLPGHDGGSKDSRQTELQTALTGGQDSDAAPISPETQAQLSMQMAQAHLQRPEKDKDVSSSDKGLLKPGYSDEYMQALQRQTKQRINNNYERCLAAIIFLEDKGGSLALTPAQARCVLKLIEAAEEDKNAEKNAAKKLNELLNKDQQLYISKQISRRPLYANGPIEEDPTAASLQKAITALSPNRP
ncbi:MAG: hypothetical protein ACI376_09010 [Candidatus Bruticola sp.]